MISTQSHWFISVGIDILEYWFIGLYIYIPKVQTVHSLKL